jgi:hypothetical protein
MRSAVKGKFLKQMKDNLAIPSGGQVMVKEVK